MPEGRDIHQSGVQIEEFIGEIERHVKTRG